MTSKEEMGRLIEQMSETLAATQWFRERNEELLRGLKDVSLSAVRYDAVGGRSGHGDSTAAKVLQRAEIEELLRQNERTIRRRLSLHASLSLIMAEVLDQDERTILWAKYAEQLGWERIARKARLSRTACFRRRRRAWRSFVGLGMRMGRRKKARTPEVSLLRVSTKSTP